MKTNKEYILYILVRNDLPSLNPGKAMAQAIHAAHLFTANWRKAKAYREWAGNHGFGTTVTLSADKATIEKLVESTQSLSGIGQKHTLSSGAGWVTDPTYPVVVPRDVLEMVDISKLSEAPKYIDDGKAVVLYRKESTCAYLFGEKSILKDWVYDLPTYS